MKKSKLLPVYDIELMNVFISDRGLLSDVYAKASENLETYHSVYKDEQFSPSMDRGGGDHKNAGTRAYPRINFINRILNAVSGEFLQRLNLPFLDVSSTSSEDDAVFCNNISDILRQKLWSSDGIAIVDDLIRNTMITGLSFLEMYKRKDNWGKLDIGIRPVYIDSVIFDPKTNFHDFDNTCSRFAIKHTLNRHDVAVFLEPYGININDIIYSYETNGLNKSKNSSKNLYQGLTINNNSIGEFNQGTSFASGSIFNITPEENTKTAEGLNSDTFTIERFYTKCTKKQRCIENNDTGDRHNYNSDDERLLIINYFTTNNITYSDISEQIPSVKLTICVNGLVIHEEIDPLSNNSFPIVPFLYNVVRGIGTTPFVFKSLLDEVKPIDQYMNDIFYYTNSILYENARSITLYDANGFKGDDYNEISNSGRSNTNMHLKAVTMKASGDKSLADMVFRVPPVQAPNFLPQFIEKLSSVLLDVCGLSDSALGGDYSGESALNTHLKLQSAWKSFEFFSIKISSAMKRLMQLFMTSLVANYNTRSLKSKFRLKAVSNVFRHKLIPIHSIESIPNDVTVNKNERDLAEIEKLMRMGIQLPHKYAVMSSNLPNKHKIVNDMTQLEQNVNHTNQLNNKLIEYKALHTGALYQSLQSEAIAKSNKSHIDTISEITKLQLEEKKINMNAELEYFKTNADYIIKAYDLVVSSGNEAIKNQMDATLDPIKTASAPDISTNISDNATKKAEVKDETSNSIDKQQTQETTSIEKEIDIPTNKVISSSSPAKGSSTTGNVNKPIPIPEEKDDIIAKNNSTGRSPMDTVTEELI